MSSRRVVIGYFLVLFACAISAPAQPKRFRPAPDYVQVGHADQAEGKKILEAFRSRSLYPEHQYINFDLTLMPRRGDERTVPGRMWVGRDARGPVIRLAIAPGVVGQEIRLLVQSGADGAVWKWPAEISGQSLAPAALFEALGGTDVTAFELQLGFLQWGDFVFEGVSKVRGRPAHVFLMYPPSGVTALHPDLSAVRVYLDTEYSAPIQFEELGAEGKPTKTVTVMDLKKVDDQWIVKTIDFHNEATRDKSRLQVKSVATRAEFTGALFSPESLSREIAAPDATQLQFVGP